MENEERTSKNEQRLAHMDRLFPEYLEEVTGDQALEWVRRRNKITEEFLADTATSQTTPTGELIPTMAELETQILDVLEDPERIPMVVVRGDVAYNFWTDAKNPRGLWRRQPFESYLSGNDEWEVLIDVDKLSKEEDKSWVWHGAEVLYPSYDTALISLSDGGSDADETREFDMETLTWVADGFFRPEAKGSLSWIDRDHCWLSQPGEPEATSSSGYPLEARVLKRGQKLEDAELIRRGAPSSMGLWAGASRDSSGQNQLIEEAIDFYTSAAYFVHGGLDAINREAFRQIPVPLSAQASVWNKWTVVTLRDDWDREEAGETWPSGSMISFLTEELMTNPLTASASVMFLPTENEVLEGLTASANRVIVTSIADVVPKMTALKPSEDGRTWNAEPIGTPPTGNPFVTVSVGAVCPLEDDRLWVVTTGYVEPSTLWLIDDEGEWTLIRQAPTMYNAEGIEVSQHFAVSKDGTKVPYFQVGKPQESPVPTLLYGYGGFEVSLLPSYSPAMGRVWLERGGTYVVANIRGGGEYGPAWHKAALKKNRHKAYEDFVAVARNLVRRGVTTTEMLGAEGGSNGGLLMGNMYTQYPDDFGAIVCAVPLLDMGRFHTLLAGASWIAEYGDPEVPEEWDELAKFSPVHLFEQDREYPPMMLTTSTKDDRVHPAHARALGFLTEESGKDVLYFENIEGGHAGAADNKQRAHNTALSWEFLWKKLSK